MTLPPTSDEQIGIADPMPPIQWVLDHGITPSLCVDVEISLAGDMYTQMLCLLATQCMGIANAGNSEGKAAVNERTVEIAHKIESGEPSREASNIEFLLASLLLVLGCSP